jgi:phage terminase large subunit-like protein
MWWYAYTHPETYLGVIGATISDVRDTCFEGESGLFNIVPHEIIEGETTVSPLRINLKNGSKIFGYSAEKFDRLRGKQFHGVWCDELSSWSYLDDAWDQLMMCTRLGDNPFKVVTTTPKPHKLVRDLSKSKEGRLISTGSSYENKGNLSDIFFKSITERYEGTRTGRQELYAEILDDVQGALWNWDMISKAKELEIYPKKRTVISVDPAITNHNQSDETGIICASSMEKDIFAVHHDVSGRYSPNEWAQKVLWLYDKFDADCIVAEVNQGGDMVESIIKNVRPNVRIKKVRATKGKYTRAEPIAALYEQNRVFHDKGLEKLEGQLCSYVPGIGESPDRMDALVWGLTELSGRTSEFNFIVI